MQTILACQPRLLDGLYNFLRNKDFISELFVWAEILFTFSNFYDVLFWWENIRPQWLQVKVNVHSLNFIEKNNLLMCYCLRLKTKNN